MHLEVQTDICVVVLENLIYYTILLPQLLKRKWIYKKIKPDIIAAGNIGCITQIANGIETPIVHTIELIDWFTGGKKPVGLLIMKKF